MDRLGATASLVAGGVAGVSVDLILFPLDTIKTRLQSPQGFKKAGGFRGIYAGVPSTAIGSFPNAAAFFITYESVKCFLHTDSSSNLKPVKHMLAASTGEVVACLIRVPSEVVKQRAQVSASSRTFKIFSGILCEEGIKGLYRGYKSTVLREALWSWRQDHVLDSWQSAVCGAFAGGFAAAVTTPLDVAKTRIMLAKAGSSTASGNVLSALHGVWRTQGLPGTLCCQEYSRESIKQQGPYNYLQVSFLEWQQSVWEVSSSSVLMTKLAACCWNLAQRVHELEMVPRPLLSRRGGCCENSYPSGEQLFDHLNRLKSGFADCDMENVFQAIGWNDIISQFARKGENGAHRSFFFFFSSELLNK
ncbi:mitochondrial S-adenosylmethionine carrier protein isoform X2 [Erinaceus europaeus]|uniref:Mitochondrial S-adenosylmethionine carrier protein n=1 Tax=Erinaceus europaeus TaxID=9365 RepID=A0ABM3YCU5_ERIEU|nr:mitochondrial S-adenosylmethionine carrier protein isoform X2 [Erinaceus europaeus]